MIKSRRPGRTKGRLARKVLKSSRGEARTKIFGHRDLATLAERWDTSLKSLHRADENEDWAYNYLYDAALALDGDISYLRDIIAELERLENKWSNEFQFAVKLENQRR